MTSGDDVSDVIELATGAVAPIEHELRRRLTVAIDERDALAIESALLKAFVNGFSAGSTEATETQIEQTGAVTADWGEQGAIPLQSPLDPPRIDPWAERYRAQD
jgi:hypothetical protein